MTTIANFDIATDVKVEFYVPNAAGDTFILGVSELGSADLLGNDGRFTIGYSELGSTDVLSDDTTGSGFIWQAAEAEVSAFGSELGGSIENNFYYATQPASLDLTLQSYTYDPTNNASIRTGTAVRVRLDDGIIDETLFYGFIDSVNVSYMVDGLNLIKIKAYDGWKRLVNTRIANWDTTSYGSGITPKETMLEVAAATGYVLSATSDDPAGLIPTGTSTNQTANNFINDAIQVGLAVVWINPATQEIELRNRPLAATGGPTTYTVGNNHPAPGTSDPYHLCMSDIGVNSDQGTSINSLKVTLSSNSAISVVVDNLDASQLYGQISQDLTINTTDATELTRWANAVFTTTPAHSVKNVQTPAIDRLGTLTQAAFFTPGTLIGVNYTTANLEIVEYYTIIKVGHTVDVNNWLTTIELWKEF